MGTALYRLNKKFMKALVPAIFCLCAFVLSSCGKQETPADNTPALITPSVEITVTDPFMTEAIS